MSRVSNIARRSDAIESDLELSRRSDWREIMGNGETITRIANFSEKVCANKSVSGLQSGARVGQ